MLTISNHCRDARSPAICVKCHSLDTAIPDGFEFDQERAWERACRDWWERANEIAREHGFREVFSAGRMGGWLYTSPLPEDGEYPAAFLADIESHLKDAPTIYAFHAFDVVREPTETRLDDARADLPKLRALWRDAAIIASAVKGQRDAEPIARRALEKLLSQIRANRIARQTARADLARLDTLQGAAS